MSRNTVINNRNDFTSNNAAIWGNGGLLPNICSEKALLQDIYAHFNRVESLLPQSL